MEKFTSWFFLAPELFVELPVKTDGVSDTINVKIGDWIWVLVVSLAVNW